MPKGHYDRSASRAGLLDGSEQQEPSALPATIRLLEAHGFINEYEAVYFKPQGAIITNPVEIAMLIERKAPIEEV